MAKGLDIYCPQNQQWVRWAAPSTGKCPTCGGKAASEGHDSRYGTKTEDAYITQTESYRRQIASLTAELEQEKAARRAAEANYDEAIAVASDYEAKWRAALTAADAAREESARWHEGMREGEPKFCWRYVGPKDVCILFRGHDAGVHEPDQGGNR